MEKVVSFQQLKPKDVIFRVTPYSREILEFVMVHPRNPQYYVFIKQENPLEFVVLHKVVADYGYYFYQNSTDVIIKEIEMTEKRLEKLRKRYEERSNKD